MRIVGARGGAEDEVAPGVSLVGGRYAVLAGVSNGVGVVCGKPPWEGRGLVLLFAL
jgi:hypothetical protein